MSDRMKKAISNELGIPFRKEIMEIKDDITEITVLEEKQVPATPADNPVPESEHDKQDYKLARGTLRKVIKQGSSVMEELKAVAVQTENPRAYEVLATMIKTLAETTTHLVDLQVKTKQLKEPPKGFKGDPDGSINIDKAVFVGTSAELLKQVKRKE